MGDDSASTSKKIDMSLDDIIKLDRKSTSRGSMKTTDLRDGRGRGRRGFQRGRRVRITAARGRSIRAGRSVQSAPNRTIPMVQSRGAPGRINKARVSRPAMAALMVLRKARQTAAEAAQAAEDAAALLQHARSRRPRFRNNRRFTEESPQAALPNSQRRSIRRQSFPSGRFRSRTASMPPSRNRTVRVQQRLSIPRRQTNRLNPRRRQRASDGFDVNVASHQLPTLASQYASVQNFRPGRERTSYYSYVNNSLPLPRRRRNRNINGVGPIDVTRVHQPVTYDSNRFSGQRARGSRMNGRRSRDAEYLAQARALIRAQTEQQQANLFTRSGTPRRQMPMNYSAQSKYEYYTPY